MGDEILHLGGMRQISQVAENGHEALRFERERVNIDGADGGGRNRRRRRDAANTRGGVGIASCRDPR